MWIVSFIIYIESIYSGYKLCYFAEPAITSTPNQSKLETSCKKQIFRAENEDSGSRSNAYEQGDGPWNDRPINLDDSDSSSIDLPRKRQRTSKNFRKPISLSSSSDESDDDELNPDPRRSNKMDLKNGKKPLSNLQKKVEKIIKPRLRRILSSGSDGDDHIYVYYVFNFFT